MYAVQLERTYSKNQILALYLSRVYFGEGAYGIEAASQRFFNKPASKLTVREAATLAGILKSPTHYDPVDQPEKSAERTRLVLDAMVETGAISAGERAKALVAPPRVWTTAPTAPAQYFVDWLDGQTRAAVGTPKQDLVVETTLDLPTEIAAGEAAKAVTTRFAKAGVSQAAVVSLDGSGRVRAMIVHGGNPASSVPDQRKVVDAFRKLDLLEIRRGEALLSDDYRLSRFRVDEASCIRTRTGKDIGVPPEVAEFGLLATDNEQCWPVAQRKPAFPRTSMLLP